MKGLTIALAIIFVYGCHAVQEKKELAKVVIYGSKDCSYCNTLKKKLTDVGISFVFKNLDEKEKGYVSEVRIKLMKAGIDEGLKIPVVEVADTILVGAGFKTVMKYLNHTD